jgi:hypothetical protein
MAAMAHLRQGRIDVAEALAERSYRCQLELGNDLAALTPLSSLIAIAWRRGNRARVRALAEQGAAIEDRHELEVWAIRGRYWLAAVELLEGHEDVAATILDAQLARLGLSDAYQSHLALRAIVHRRRGDIEAAVAALDAALPAGRRPVSWSAALGLVERGWCELARADLESAERWFTSAVKAGRALLDDSLRASGLEGQAAVAGARGDRATALDLLARADDVRTSAPASSNLHGPEVEALRARLAHANG